MSREYRIEVCVEEFNSALSLPICEALLDEFRFEDVERMRSRIILTGDRELPEDETQEQLTDRLARAAWDANRGYCYIEVVFKDLSAIPTNAHIRNEESFLKDEAFKLKTVSS